MRGAFFTGLLLAQAFVAAAAESAWRAMPLPPEAEQLNRIADSAATASTAASANATMSSRPSFVAWALPTLHG